MELLCSLPATSGGEQSSAMLATKTQSGALVHVVASTTGPTQPHFGLLLLSPHPILHSSCPQKLLGCLVILCLVLGPKLTGTGLGLAVGSLVVVQTHFLVHLQNPYSGPVPMDEALRLQSYPILPGNKTH